MQLKNASWIVVLVIAALITSSSIGSAFSVTGKQIVTICPGTNNHEITVANPGDNILIVKLLTTDDQYYAEQNISFSLTENWYEKYDKNKWQRVNWVDTKYGEAIIAPHGKETLDFTINVPENVTKGTFYAKLEVKDTGKKEGTIVIRPIYVSQVVAHISSQQSSQFTLSLCGFAFVLLFMVLGVLLILVRRKKH